MRIKGITLVGLLAVAIAIDSGAAEEAPSPTVPAGEETLRVLDLVILATNQVLLGTNTVSLATATNLMAEHRDTLDAVTIHGSIPDAASVEEESSTLATLAHVGVPLLIVEKDGEYAWRKQSTTDGVRTVKVGTSEFDTLRRLWEKQGGDAKSRSGPTLETTIKWDTTTGAYELSRVQLGLFGERVWLMHEQGESDEDAGTIGIQLKKEW